MQSTCQKKRSRGVGCKKHEAFVASVKKLIERHTVIISLGSRERIR